MTIFNISKWMLIDRTTNRIAVARIIMLFNMPFHSILVNTILFDKEDSARI